MLVTLAVIGLGVVGIAYGFSAVVRSSGDTQAQAELDAAAQYLAGYMQSDVPYSPCATSYPAPPLPSPSPTATSSATPSASPSPLPAPAAYAAAGVTWPATFPVTVSSPTSSPGYASVDSAPCSEVDGAPSSLDYGVQEITITVTDHGLSVTQVVWKDDLS
jgi:hypothetical protein